MSTKGPNSSFRMGDTLYICAKITGIPEGFTKEGYSVYMSIDGGKTYGASPVNAYLDVFKNSNGAIEAIGDWFSFADVDTKNNTLKYDDRGATTFDVVYKFVKTEGSVTSYLSITVVREAPTESAG